MQIVLSIIFLALMESMLSLDNAMALAGMVKHLPEGKRRQALTYGIWGAFGFRFVALFFISHLLQLFVAKVIVSGYLLWLAIAHFLRSPAVENGKVKGPKESFWLLIVLVEITDLAFSFDSILAASALSQTLSVVFLGGVLGIIAMRFASGFFVSLMDRFPRLEDSAYFLILLTGGKLLLSAFSGGLIDFDSTRSPWFWGFWIAMSLALIAGFVSSKREVAVSAHK